MNQQPALSGMRVFDLSQGVAGPYCTMLMAAQGADVIKVEPPSGDWLRHGRHIRGQAPAALAVNAGKRSIALNLKDPSARAMALRIAEGCDVVVESFRPGVAERLGLGSEALRAHKPELVYCSISGFGSQSALGARPVIDHIAQAYSGWMAVNADANGQPQRTRNVVLADQITGLYAYQAIASALIRRLRFGVGEHLDVTLVGSMAAFLALRITTHILSDGKVANAEFLPPTGDYLTRDGWLVVAVQKAPDVERLCTLLGRADLLADTRFSTPKARATNADALRQELSLTLVTRDALEWERELAPMGVMVCAARDIGGFLASQHADGLALLDEIDIADIGACPLVRIPGAPAWSARATPPLPPGIGEHGRQILQEIGASDSEIANLLAPA